MEIHTHRIYTMRNTQLMGAILKAVARSSLHYLFERESSMIVGHDCGRYAAER